MFETFMSLFQSEQPLIHVLHEHWCLLKILLGTEVLNGLSRALKLFKLTEFKSIVLPLFEEITWSEVKKRIIKEKKTFTVQSLTDLLINQVKRLEVDDLLTRVHNLQLLEKAVHPERVIWKAVYLEQGEGRFCTKWSAKFFQQELKRKCTTNNLSTVIQVIHRNNLLWIMVVVKKVVHNRGVQLGRPTYLAFVPLDKYLFFACGATNSLLNAVKETFGADYIKKCNLSGRDIKSLYQMLKNKENSAFNTRSVVLDNQTFTRVVHPERTLHGLDFSRTNDRRRYIKSLLGDNPPVVQRLEIEVRNCRWQAKHLVRGIDMKLSSTVTLTAPNIPDMIENMATTGALRTPAPHFISQYCHLGKNLITLRPTEEHEGSDIVF
uniref:Uncharacterized protein n=1 Tax=Timema douglasi TaxID=61478 RepID=A0A7R8ZE53_TIMDO|nr:unnamed protein product [Timema douglasi]